MEARPLRFVERQGRALAGQESPGHVVRRIHRKGAGSVAGGRCGRTSAHRVRCPDWPEWWSEYLAFARDALGDPVGHDVEATLDRDGFVTALGELARRFAEEVAEVDEPRATPIPPM